MDLIRVKYMILQTKKTQYFCFFCFFWNRNIRVNNISCTFALLLPVITKNIYFYGKKKTC